jgi:hypothetical protein
VFIGEQDGKINPERDAYFQAIILAQSLMGSKQEPVWFKEHREEIQDAAKAIGLSDRLSVYSLMVFVLAYDLAHKIPIVLQPDKICERLKRLRTRMKKDRKDLVELMRASRPSSLQQGGREIEPDRIELGPDPYEEMVEAIDRFLQRSDVVNPGRGRRRTITSVVDAHLKNYLVRHKPGLSRGDQQDFIARLLDRVGRLHHRKSRARLADPDDVSAYKHLNPPLRSARVGTRKRNRTKSVE